MAFAQQKKSAKFIINCLNISPCRPRFAGLLTFAAAHHVHTVYFRCRNPPELSGLFCRQRPHRGAQQPAGAGQRPHAHVHQQRHGAVQGRVPRHRQAPLRARGQRAGLPARRRQAQRPGKRGLHRAPPHLLRDAGQLELWRLLQERKHSVGLGAADQGLWPAG